MREKIIIEEMTKAHIDAVCEIENDCFPAPWSRKSFYDELANENAYYFTAAVDGKTVGYGGLWHIVNEGHITNIAVAREYRRNGIGRALVLKMIDFAKKKEMIGLTLEVNINNHSAQRLYSSLGFKPEGMRKNYYAETKEDAVIMWKYFEDYEEI